MKRITITVLSLAALVTLAMAPSFADANSDCCHGQSCCGQKCCKNHQK